MLPRLLLILRYSRHDGDMVLRPVLSRRYDICVTLMVLRHMLSFSIHTLKMRFLLITLDYLHYDIDVALYTIFMFISHSHRVAAVRQIQSRRRRRDRFHAG